MGWETWPGPASNVIPANPPSAATPSPCAVVVYIRKLLPFSVRHIIKTKHFPWDTAENRHFYMPCGCRNIARAGVAAETRT